MYIIDRDLIKYWYENNIKKETVHAFLSHLGFIFRRYNTYLKDMVYIFDDNKKFREINTWDRVNVVNYTPIIISTFQIWQDKQSGIKPYLLTRALQIYWKENNIKLQYRKEFIEFLGLEHKPYASYYDRDVAYTWNKNKKANDDTAWMNISLEEYSLIKREQFEVWYQDNYPKTKGWLLDSKLQKHWIDSKISKATITKFLISIGLHNKNNFAFNNPLLNYYWKPSDLEQDTTAYSEIFNSRKWNIITKEMFDEYLKNNKLGWYLSVALIKHWNDNKTPQYDKDAFLKSIDLHNIKGLKFINNYPLYAWDSRKTQCNIKDSATNEFIEITLNQWLNFNNNSKKEEKHVNRLQKQKTQVTGGDLPEGCRIKGRPSKAVIRIGHLSYKAVKSCC